MSLDYHINFKLNKMSEKKLNTKQGHWLLAKMGKKILRPGGVELTHKMIDYLGITDKDNIVEFAPGLGYTAKLVLSKYPNSYIGIEVNKAATDIALKNNKQPNVEIITASASDTTLPDSSISKIYGEAILSMYPDHKKKKIIKEASRILQKGGLYAIHELGLTPDSLDIITKDKICIELANSIHVNARPLTMQEWKLIIENEGFKIMYTATNPMHLLNTKRMIKDEGFFSFLKIMCNILCNRKARKQIKEMKDVFKNNEKNINAIVIIAEKL